MIYALGKSDGLVLSSHRDYLRVNCIEAPSALRVTTCIEGGRCTEGNKCNGRCAM